MSKNDLKKKVFLIANIDKDIKNIEINLPIIIFPSIAGKKLIYKRKIKAKNILEYENGVQFNNFDKKLNVQNGEFFEGIIDKKVKEICLKKGIYSWPTGDKYIGSFNTKNTYEGKGKIKFKDNSEFDSIFTNGFPTKNGKFKKKLKDGSNLYVQSDFKKINKANSNSNIIYDGKTMIEIKKSNETIFTFLGLFKNEKLFDNIFIKKKIDNNRFVETRIFYQSGKMHGLLQIKDIIPGNTFQFIGEYKYGYRDGFFKIKDTVNNILISEEIHDLQNSANKIKNIIKNKNKDIFKFLIELYRKKIRDIKYTKFYEKMKNIAKLYLNKHFKKIHFYLNQCKILQEFNKGYKTNYNLDIKIIHLDKIKLGLDGFNLLCKINLLNLIDISLSEVGIEDFSSFQKSHFPNLKILSLGKNNISSIDFINFLPFPKLENLMLGVNLIENLSPLSKFKSNSIKVLFLLENKISNIKPLVNMDTQNLEEFDFKLTK